MGCVSVAFNDYTTYIVDRRSRYIDIFSMYRQYASPILAIHRIKASRRAQQSWCAKARELALRAPTPPPRLERGPSCRRRRRQENRALTFAPFPTIASHKCVIKIGADQQTTLSKNFRKQVIEFFILVIFTQKKLNIVWKAAKQCWPTQKMQRAARWMLWKRFRLRKKWTSYTPA